MTALRLLADDLTGALDTAAELTALAGPVPVFWASALPDILPAHCAIDSETREADGPAAVAATTRLAPALAAARPAYKKVDSLLRGHTMAELAACWRTGAWDHCVVAPAFPFQGRITVGGVQIVRRPDGTTGVVADVVALLAEAGIAADRHRAGAPLGAGVTVFDAETDADLAEVAALGRAAGSRVLWCGSAGLAQALVGESPTRMSRPRLGGRVLGLFGSDQDSTRRQLEACGDKWLRLPAGGQDGGRIGARLERDGIVLASLDLPVGLGRGEAANRIADTFATAVHTLDPPDVLLVAGGETLRGLCGALGATALEVQGQFEPGLPFSVLRGGLWDGTRVVSKSGAFGGPTLWRDLLAAHGHSVFHDTQEDGPRARKVEA